MAAKLISFDCPKCGANLSVEKGKDKYYCSYCGATIIVDDGVERKEETYHININSNSTIRKIDEAALRKAIDEGNLSKRKYEDEILEKEKKEQQKINKRKNEIKTGIMLLLGGTIVYILITSVFKPADPNSSIYFIGGIGLVAAFWGFAFLIPNQNDK